MYTETLITVVVGIGFKTHINVPIKMFVKIFKPNMHAFFGIWPASYKDFVILKPT